MTGPTCPSDLPRKLCKKCLVVKPLSEFYVHKQMGDGHLSKCKECTKADVRENRAENIAYYQNYDRLRYDDGSHVPPRPANDNAYARVRRWRMANPEKYTAHLAVDRSVSSGVLKRPTVCSECGQGSEFIEAHHDDYSKPLQVRWLCKKCHGHVGKKPRLHMQPRKRRGFRGAMKPTRRTTNP